MMSMARASRGRGIKGVVKYGMGDGHGKVIGGNVGTDPDRAVARMVAASRRRPDIDKPVWHQALRLPKGEHVSSEKLAEIGDEYVKRMGFDPDHPYVLIEHDDPEGQHVHVIGCRVSFSGKVWLGQNENLKSTSIIRDLEKDFGLRVYFPQEPDPTKPRGLKKGEVEMALRTGKEPPRQKLQKIVEAALDGKPSTTDFIARVEAAGASVRANVASTGRMNGFSFEIDGISFTGSKLSEGFKWKNLEARLDYEQDRDSEILQRYRATVADREGGDGATVADTSAAGVANRAVTADLQDAERRKESARTVRQSEPGAANNTEGTGGRVDESINKRAEIDGFGHEYGNTGANTLINGSAETTRAVTTERERDANGKPEADERSQQPDEQTVVRNDGSSGVAGKRGRDGGWDSRFRLASAKKRAAASADAEPGAADPGRAMGGGSDGQGDTERKRVDPADTGAARSLNPATYLRSQGFIVKDRGVHLSVLDGKDEVYRVDFKDGKWLWCDSHGNNGGDNIALVREIEPGTKFVDAVYKLNGAPSVAQRQDRAEPRRTQISLPPSSEADARAGRDYLKSRGVSEETIREAEQSGFLRHMDGAVMFVGYDGQTVRAVTARAVSADSELQKKDLRGTDKRFPPILHGSDELLIVEGGVDALAARDLRTRFGMPAPTVIVSGGVSVRGYLDNPEVQRTLKSASRVIICGENEKDGETQRRTNESRKKLLDRVREVAPEVKSGVWTPPSGVKDIAEFAAKRAAEAEAEKAKARAAEQARLDEQRKAEREQERRSRPAPAPRPPGMSRSRDDEYER